MAATAWVVVIEAELASHQAPVETWRLRRLLANMPGVDPIGLHSAERVAVQVHIEAPGEVEALSLALADFRGPLPLVGLERLHIVRAEVMTRDEFERDCLMSDQERLAARQVPDGPWAHAGSRAGPSRCDRSSRTR